MSMRMRAAALGVLALLGCGGEEPPAAEPEARARPAARAAAPEADAGAPVIDEVALSPEAPRSGDQVVARVSASDPDGDEVAIEYRWSVGGEPVDESSAFLEIGQVSRGTQIEVSVVASDGDHRSAPARATARVGNQPPRVTGVAIEPRTDLTVGRDVVATPEGDDPDGDRVQFRYRWLIDGELLADDGPTLPGDRFERGDEVALEVVAHDGSDDSDAFRSEPIEVANAAPRITSTPGALGKDGVFRYEVTAEDPDGDSAFRYRLVTAPTGMAIGFDDGVIAWRPGGDAEGTHAVEVEVSDLFGGRATQPFEIRLSYASSAETPPASAGEDEEAASDGEAADEIADEDPDSDAEPDADEAGPDADDEDLEAEG
jgi:hypothetical protein